jgi:[acyl-carrier-protein] S-malonyltransferase
VVGVLAVKIAFIFPGQNSQRVGMGKALCEVYPHIKERYFDRADEILGFPISRLCFEGPADELIATENQQPAIFLVSCALDAALRERGLTPAAVAGHSLGEYSALVAAGAFDFETGLRLTRRRGELMAEIAARTGGSMAAVLGLPSDEVEAVCREAAQDGVVEVANYNSPDQTVVSGEDGPVQRAMEEAKRRGASRVLPLKVSAPFHCSLMAPLADAFEPVLRDASLTEPAIPVVANVTADYERTTNEIERNLVEQLASSVRWSASIARFVADGFDTFVEVGPGKVLTGLMKANAPGAAAFQTNDPAGLEAVLEALAH